jgi:hypothetical protein
LAGIKLGDFNITIEILTSDIVHNFIIILLDYDKFFRLKKAALIKFMKKHGMIVLLLEKLK